MMFGLFTNCDYSQTNKTTKENDKPVDKATSTNNIKKPAKGSNAKKDSTIKTSSFQQSITKNEKQINNFYYNEHKIKELKKGIDEDSASIQKNKNQIKRIENKIKTLETNKKKKVETKIQNEKKLAENDKSLKSITKKISNEANKLSGEIDFSYKGVGYKGFVVDFKLHNLSIHLNKENSSNKASQKFYTLGKLKTHLESKKQEVLMLTNAGMYTPKRNPEGLLISESKLIEPIDTTKGPKNKYLNFYMMPNGVFYTQNGKAFIENTEAFNKKYKKKEIKPEFATQSGPLLLENNNHHKALNHNSRSKHIRSGVGIMQNGKVVFLISETPTNFHYFTTVFKNIFGCSNALFLDGAISKMYLKNSNSKELAGGAGGGFGPMFAITKKNEK